MQSKLTVRVDHELIQAAKRYASRRKISLSQLIEGYLKTLSVIQDEPAGTAPVLQRLSGILPSDVTEEEIHQHWDAKYG
jgi:hypothetical protein